jgi:hypothetical protein
MHAIEQRLTSGGARPEDVEWVAYLDTLFAGVPLSGFVANGMGADSARDFVALLALARRLMQSES